MAGDFERGFIAIIPARGGSKGLPRKNVLPLGGKPLIAWTIEAALGCAQVAETWVTTEDAEIATVARAWGAQVIDRPANLATDAATSSAVARHALERRATLGPMPTAFVLLQPTSPLRDANHLAEALDAFADSGCRSLISVCEAEHHPLKALTIDDEGRLRSLFGRDHLETPRQALPPAWRQNGAIYAMRCRDFLEEARGFLLEPAVAYPMEQAVSIDIDRDDDLADADAAMRRR